MLLLPTLQATLRPCPISAANFMAHEKGHFCGHCQRVVQDFSQSIDPKADLAAARAASPDGRVCGSFRREQVVAPLSLTRRLKWFVLALLLVVGQGLTAYEALAQVKKSTPSHCTTTIKRQVVKPQSIQLASDVEELPAKPSVMTLPADADLKELKPVESLITIGEVVTQKATLAKQLNTTQLPTNLSDRVYGYVEQYPTLGEGGLAKVVAYIQERVVYPSQDGKLIPVEGRVFVNFWVDAAGKVHDAQIVKGLHPLFDAEVLRVVRELPTFEPGRQNSQPVDSQLTMPITFKLKK